MDESSTDNNITAKFRSNAAYLLASHVSPSLAAVHAHRTAIQSHSPLTLTPLHCPRCTHAPISTRVAVANQRTTGTRRTLTGGETKNADAKRTRRSRRNNKTHSVQTGKSESSSSPSSPRGSRVRIMRSCAACGYLGEQAFERHPCENNERHPKTLRSAVSSAGLDDVLSSHSVPVPVSRSVTPALVKETETRSIISIEPGGAKFKVNQVQVEADAGTMAGTPITQPATEPPIVSSSSSSSNPTPMPQSRSAIKRQKKKIGLQEMLARSKEHQQSTLKRERGHGLTAFLSGL